MTTSVAFFVLCFAIFRPYQAQFRAKRESMAVFPETPPFLALEKSYWKNTPEDILILYDDYEWYGSYNTLLFYERKDTFRRNCHIKSQFPNYCTWFIILVFIGVWLPPEQWDPGTYTLSQKDDGTTVISYDPQELLRELRGSEGIIIIAHILVYTTYSSSDSAMLRNIFLQ